MNEIRKMPFNDESIINTLRTSGRSKQPEDFNILEVFHEKYHTRPSLYKYDISDDNYFDWKILIENLTILYPNMENIFIEEVSSINSDLKYTKQQTLLLSDGIILHLEGDLAKHLYLESHSLKDTDNVATYNLFLLSKPLSKDEDDKLKDVFKKSVIKEKDTIIVNMISFENGNFNVKDFDIKDKLQKLELLDLHYGAGFEKFNTELISRLLSSDKGLTLFHGVPGSGKTMYVRHLIQEIKKDNTENNILYFPPTMIGSITEPSFINFISDWVSESKGKNYLLIEDAEPLLESRNQTRNIGITNLLNLTDGILNDVLSIQIIATFNTDLSNIDSAVLREGRLLARKEFKVLTKENALILAKEINIDESLITNNMSLADIYALKKSTKSLTHDIVDNSIKIGFN